MSHKIEPSIDDAIKIQTNPYVENKEYVQGDALILRSKKDKKRIPNFLTNYKEMWRKKSFNEKVILIIMLVVFILYGFSLLFPLIWAVYNSFKPAVEFDKDRFALPMSWTIDNYKHVFDSASTDGINIFTSIINSIWQSLLSTVLGLAASSITAYVCAKYRFKGSAVIYTIAIFIQIIPLVGSVTGMYQLLHNDLHIANNPFTIWPIWFSGFGFSFLMLYSSFKNVSWSYAESAFIDGAGHFRVFLHIMLPMIKPILASLFVVNFMTAWNDYMTAYLYIRDFPPLSLAVYLLGDTAERISFTVYLSVIVISIIPILALFISFQKLIMENTTVGGLKG